MEDFIIFFFSILLICLLMLCDKCKGIWCMFCLIGFLIVLVFILCLIIVVCLRLKFEFVNRCWYLCKNFLVFLVWECVRLFLFWFRRLCKFFCSLLDDCFLNLVVFFFVLIVVILVMVVFLYIVCDIFVIFRSWMGIFF